MADAVDDRRTLLRSTDELSPPKAAHTDTIALSLLVGDKVRKGPKGWPTTPKPVRTSWFLVIRSTLFDILLFAHAVAFLAFASFFSCYDQAPIAEHPRAAEMLQSATKM